MKIIQFILNLNIITAYLSIDIDSDFVFFECFHEHVIRKISGLDISRSHMVRQDCSQLSFILAEFFQYMFGNILECLV